MFMGRIYLNKTATLSCGIRGIMSLFELIQLNMKKKEDKPRDKTRETSPRGQET